MNKYLNQHITPILSFLLFVFLFSCGNNRHVDTDQRLKNKNDKELEAALAKQDEVPFDFMSVRISVDFKSKKQNQSFSTYLNLKVDSAFSGSIKVAGVIFATYLVNQDSLFFVNKWEKCYSAESLAYISTLFGTDVEFDFFQDVLLGLPIGYEEGTKYQQINDKDHYILSSHKKRDYRKLENERLEVEEDLMLIQYHLSADSLDVYKINIDIPVDTTSITVNYLERKLEEGNSVPEETSIVIVNPSDSISINLNYAPVKLNEPKTIKIKIPDSYIACP